MWIRQYELHSFPPTSSCQYLHPSFQREDIPDNKLRQTAVFCPFTLPPASFYDNDDTGEIYNFILKILGFYHKFARNMIVL